ncbi:MAG: ATP-grasp domain-containing protein [Planctomycetota bacterium]|nr:ATP-grasp domain-containing protein [Planctomycetota bacterium]
MKRRRILALVPEGQIPPDSVEGLSDQQVLDVKMEYDVVTALQNLGHEVQCLDVRYDLTPIREAVESSKPHIVFNMLEEFHGIAAFDQNVVAYLELLRQAYTGCNPRGLVLARDKALAKKILTYHRIPTPRFAVVPRGRKVKTHKRLTFPLIVKSTIQDASAGISQASIVANLEQLEKRVAFVHESTESDALVEEYIEGRELYLAVLGNVRLQTFPIWEIQLDTLPEGAPRIATEKVKFDAEYQKKHKIQTGPAKDLPEGMAERIAKVGKRIYKRLGLSGYARIDLRLRESGEIYVLEANPNPDLSMDEDFALACEAGGLKYEPLVQRIVTLGERWRAGIR